MKVSEIKAELDMRMVGYAGVYEKTELVDLLSTARAEGKADPTLIDRFNKENLERRMNASGDGDDDQGLAGKLDPDQLKDMTASDGTLPGGMTAEQMQKLMSNPEMTVLMQNPKLQQVMKAVMEKGPAAMNDFMGDEDAIQVLQQLTKAMQEAQAA